MKYAELLQRQSVSRRSPHGERGLKYNGDGQGQVGIHKSLPSRGAWIEILPYRLVDMGEAGRSPHGERGLKFPDYECYRALREGRSPPGERGRQPAELNHSTGNRGCKWGAV